MKWSLNWALRVLGRLLLAGDLIIMIMLRNIFPLSATNEVMMT